MGSPMQISEVDKKIPTNKVREEDINNHLKQSKELSFYNDNKLNENIKIVQTNKVVITVLCWK